MSNLYEIGNEINELAEREDIDDNQKILIVKDLAAQLNQKAENIVKFNFNIASNIDSIDAEIERLNSLKTVLKHKQDRIKEYVKGAMEYMDIQKIETPLGKISIAKNPPSVEILDENIIPDDYKIKKEVINIDKKAILNTFKENGEVINGTRIIVDKTNLRIK